MEDMITMFKKWRRNRSLGIIRNLKDEMHEQPELAKELIAALKESDEDIAFLKDLGFELKEITEEITESEKED